MYPGSRQSAVCIYMTYSCKIMAIPIPCLNLRVPLLLSLFGSAVSALSEGWTNHVDIAHTSTSIYSYMHAHTHTHTDTHTHIHTHTHTCTHTHTHIHTRMHAHTLTRLDSLILFSNQLSYTILPYHFLSFLGFIIRCSFLLLS